MGFFSLKKPRNESNNQEFALSTNSLGSLKKEGGGGTKLSKSLRHATGERKIAENYSAVSPKESLTSSPT